MTKKTIDDRLIIESTLNNIESVTKIITTGANVKYKSCLAIKIAACNGYYDLVKLFTNYPINQEAYDYCLIVAASNGHNDIVKLILDNHRTNDNAVVNSAIQWAVLNQYDVTANLISKFYNSEIDLNQTKSNNKYILGVTYTDKRIIMHRKMYTNDRIVNSIEVEI